MKKRGKYACVLPISMWNAYEFDEKREITSIQPPQNRHNYFEKNRLPRTWKNCMQKRASNVNGTYNIEISSRSGTHAKFSNSRELCVFSLTGTKKKQAFDTCKIILDISAARSEMINGTFDCASHVCAYILHSTVL